MKLKHTLLAALISGFAAYGQAALVEGEDYVVLSNPLPQLEKDKIEVAEFFGYSCVHCYKLEPVLQKHSKAWSKDTYLRPIHVVWQPEMMGLARISAAVNSSGLKYQANMPIFTAVYEQKIPLNDPAVFRKWADKQTTFDSKKLLAAYDSFANPTQAEQMGKLTEQFNIDGTPTIIVGGKYKMSFKGDNWDASMAKVEEMAAKVRQERGMPAASSDPGLRSKGAAIAKSANQ